MSRILVLLALILGGCATAPTIKMEPSRWYGLMVVEDVAPGQAPRLAFIFGATGERLPSGGRKSSSSRPARARMGTGGSFRHPRFWSRSSGFTRTETSTWPCGAKGTAARCCFCYKPPFGTGSRCALRPAD